MRPKEIGIIQISPTPLPSPPNTLRNKADYLCAPIQNTIQNTGLTVKGLGSNPSYVIPSVSYSCPYSLPRTGWLK